MSIERHPHSEGWVFPPEHRAALPAPLQRINLRDLAARPGRFEHHLVQLGFVGDAQIELPTAGEPLAFAHANFGDEYLVVLPTGSSMIDGFPFRVFLQDRETGEDLARVNHRVGELVLHPYGYLHFPGKLRPPYTMPPGMKRCGLTIVCCSRHVVPPGPERRLWVQAGLEDRAKQYTDAQVPVIVADMGREPPGVVARVGNACWELLERPVQVAPALGGYLTVLEAEAGSAFFDQDLIYLPAGSTLDSTGIVRALLLCSDTAEVEAPPSSWTELPIAPFEMVQEGSGEGLPYSAHGIQVEAVDDDLARVSIGDACSEVPRHWLARLLFRTALHLYRWGYVETYGGFYYDDTQREQDPDAPFVIGLVLRDQGHRKAEVQLDAQQIREVVEGLYRAVAPAGYTEQP